MTEQRKIPRDGYGNRFYEVGDLVTRDSTDVHRVVDHNGSDGHAPDGMTVVCIKAPSQPWTEVGEEEFNTCRRYSPVGEEDEGPVISLADALTAQRRLFDDLRIRIAEHLLRPIWDRYIAEVVGDMAAAAAVRQPIGKPLNRRARRRNRGRARAAKVAAMRSFKPSMEWTWPPLSFASAA